MMDGWPLCVPSSLKDSPFLRPKIHRLAGDWNARGFGFSGPEHVRMFAWCMQVQQIMVK